jgi:hypothetical protein
MPTGWWEVPGSLLASPDWSSFLDSANHESPRTTKLYDRRQDEISLDEVERIAI